MLHLSPLSLSLGPWRCRSCGDEPRVDRNSTMRASWRAGWFVGGVGLDTGFGWPLLVNPQGSVAPLLGILVTGPLGFVAGAIRQVWCGRLKWSA